MATILNMVQNDTAPAITFNVTRTASGVVNLTGATVNFNIGDPDSGVLTNTGHTTCTVATPTTGQAIYTFEAGDIPNAKAYKCDLAITYANSEVETVYNQVILNVRAEA
jgi:BppU N-terminal domain